MRHQIQPRRERTSSSAPANWLPLGNFASAGRARSVPARDGSASQLY
ncbi:hypothetical protein RESH_02361 [Rhodopirellula europaea SH398]|uniref:Uncharacterized protein n=1 Tax=Rhodopirellula europaea SH398 TaxID=1263868 RepID=M5SH63_9BACT|nr:hypothetical protein RESH_02361 [Rhodopirellula europaea SH398]